MREVSEQFLLGVSGVAATLIGTFLVGVFFYLDSPLHRARRAGSASADRYMRAGARWVFVIYSIPVMMPLVLAGLTEVWGAVVFVVLGALLLASTVETTVRLLRARAMEVTAGLVVNEILTTLAVLVLLALTWILGGWVPAAAAYTPSLLLAIMGGFASTTVLVMAVFRTARSR